MTRYISPDLRQAVIHRAKSRCEYCCLSQEGQEAVFHIDHVIPVSVGGQTALENLALACVSCSLRKSARQDAIDPDSKTRVPLYNPRRDQWKAHFRWEGVYLVGLTPIGCATIDALDMNRSLICAIREEETARGRHPFPLQESL